MAVLEQGTPTVVDDTAPLTCVITGAETVHSHTVFVVRVHRGAGSETAWQVRRRYSDFVALCDALKVSGVELALPPKRLLGKMEREFVAERQAGLQQLIDQIVAHPMLAASLAVKRFLDEANYKDNYVERSLQFVSMFLRSEPQWEVVEPMKELGGRIRKCFFLVKRKGDAKERWLLSWTHFGPDRFLPGKDLIAAMKLLPNVQHPSIVPVVHAVASDNGVLVIRAYHKEGAVRDAICKTRPIKIAFLKRYCAPKSVSGFSLPQIRQYGRQILEAVQFLHDKGLAFHHLHSGNILIEKEVCKLIDVESYFVGAPPYYKQFYRQFRKIHSSESIDVYSFGQLLYEMVYARPLNAATVDALPSTTPALIRSVLESILSVEACKNGLPTLEGLLSHTLFADETVITVGLKPQLKIPSKLKEAFKKYKETQERRLKEEQKVIGQVRRLSKAKARHGSDSERRRRKLEARKKSEKNLDVVRENGAAEAEPPAPASPGIPPPPPVAAAPVPPPPPPVAATAPVTPPAPSTGAGRGALLGSITGFNKNALKRSETVDKSGPRI